MPGTSGSSQLTRLLQLLLALQAKRYPSARELAESCEVSRRTIYRDLERLKAAAIPVEYNAERQGYHLAAHFAFQAPTIDEKEAAAMLVLASAVASDGAVGLRRYASSGAWKVMNALSGDTRMRVSALAELIQSRTEPVDPPPARRPIYEAVLQALMERRQLRLKYLEPETSDVNSTKMSPYRLVLDGPRWTLIGRSSLHRKVHTLPLPWVQRVELTDDRYTIPPRFSPDRFLGKQRAGRRDENWSAVWLRFSARLAPEIQETAWQSADRMDFLPDGRLDLHLARVESGEFLRSILGYGDQVEVMAPLELRDQIRVMAERIAGVHATVSRQDEPAAPPESRSATFLSHPPSSGSSMRGD